MEAADRILSFWNQKPADRAVTIRFGAGVVGVPRTCPVCGWGTARRLTMSVPPNVAVEFGCGHRVDASSFENKEPTAPTDVAVNTSDSTR